MSWSISALFQEQRDLGSCFRSSAWCGWWMIRRRLFRKNIHTHSSSRFFRCEMFSIAGMKLLPTSRVDSWSYGHVECLGHRRVWKRTLLSKPSSFSMPLWLRYSWVSSVSSSRPSSFVILFDWRDRILSFFRVSRPYCCVRPGARSEKRETMHL